MVKTLSSFKQDPPTNSRIRPSGGRGGERGSGRGALKESLGRGVPTRPVIPDPV